MKKVIFLLLIICRLFASVEAQQKEISYKQQPNGKGNSISAGIDIPFGKFSATHRFGIGLDYSWSNHRHGRMDGIPLIFLGVTVNSWICL